MTKKNGALTSSALPVPSHAASAPARAGQLDAGDEIVDARLLRRHVEREPRSDQESEREQSRRVDDPGERDDAEEDRRRYEHDLRDHDDPAAVEDVGQRAGGEPEQDERRIACGLHQRDHQRRRRQRRHQPRGHRGLHRVAERHADRTEIEHPERCVPEWRILKEFGYQRSGARVHAQSVA
jgi:hypothetical protein